MDQRLGFLYQRFPSLVRNEAGLFRNQQSRTRSNVATCSTTGSNNVHGLRPLLHVVGVHVIVAAISRARSPAILEDEVPRPQCETGARRGRGHCRRHVRVIDVTDDMNIVAADIGSQVPSWARVAAWSVIVHPKT